MVILTDKQYFKNVHEFADNQLNNAINPFIEENKELKDKIKKQQKIIEHVNTDLLAIDDLLVVYITDINKTKFIGSIEMLLNNIIDYLNDKCTEMYKEL